MIADVLSCPSAPLIACRRAAVLRSPRLDAAPVASVEAGWQRPDPGVLALVTAVVEVMQGRRASRQLSRWADEEVVARLGALARSAPTPGLRLVGVRMQRAGQRAEVAVRVADGPRQHAVAMACRAQGGRWVLTALDCGPLRPRTAGAVR